jgi:hypothetical protein
MLLRVGMKDDRNQIGEPPIRRDRLIGPSGTRFARGLVVHGEQEIHFPIFRSYGKLRDDLAATHPLSSSHDVNLRTCREHLHFYPGPPRLRRPSRASAVTCELRGPRTLR